MYRGTTSFMKMTQFTFLFVMWFHVALGLSRDISHLSVDEITSMFGTEGCIEGSLLTFEQSSAIPPAVLAHEEFTPQVMRIKEGVSAAQRWASPNLVEYSTDDFANVTAPQMTVEKLTTDESENIASKFGEKSPMSVINELSNLMKMRHQYQLKDVQGPPHERQFSVSLKLGDDEHIATGSSIKTAQQLVANKFLQYTQYQQPLQAMAHKIKMPKWNAATKTAVSLVYETAAKQKVPVSFEVESQTGPPHKPTFVTRCTLGGKISRGQGGSKKLSKRAAAENMLAQLDSQTSILPPNVATSKTSRKRRSSRKKRRSRSLFNVFQQLVGGLQTGQSSLGNMASELWIASGNNTTYGKGLSGKLVTFVKQLMSSGSEYSDEVVSRSSLSKKDMSSSKPQTLEDERLSPKDTLTHMAHLLDFQFEFSDLPKGHNGEFLSLVSLSTNQPTICLGAGSTIGASHEQAAQRALKALWNMDTDLIPSTDKGTEELQSGNWLQWGEKIMQKAQDALMKYH